MLFWLCTNIIWCTCIKAYITDKYIYVSHQSPTARKNYSNYLSKHDFMLMNWNVSQFFYASMDAWIKIWKNIIISIFCSFLSCSAIEVVLFLFFPWLKSSSAVHFCEAWKSFKFYFFLDDENIFYDIFFCLKVNCIKFPFHFQRDLFRCINNAWINDFMLGFFAANLKQTV